MAQVILIRPACVRPDEISIDSKAKVQPASGLLYLAAALVDDGFTVSILDQTMDQNWPDLLKEQLAEDTLYVGITCLTGLMITNGIDIAREARSHSDCPIVWGGAHPSIEQDTTIASDMVDIIVVGEGEVTAVELARALREGTALSDVDGLVYKDGGAVHKTSPRAPYDLNQLPRLPIELIDLEGCKGNATLQVAFNFTKSFALAIETSRGCTHRCTYCVMASDKYKTRAVWRGMSAQKLADIVEGIQREYGIDAFTFVDDNFFVDVERTEAFLDELEARDIKIEWFADVRMDTIVKKMDEAFLKRLEACGLRSLGIGIESGSNRMLKFIRKGETRETHIEANKKLAVTSIMPRYGFIQGLPTETREDAEQTYTLIVQMLKDNPNGSHALNKLLPTPNTPLFEECAAKGLERPESFEEWSSYCDTAWRRGPSVWMEKETVDFIMTVLYFGIVLTMANPMLLKKGGGFRRFLLRAATRTVMFRINHKFYSCRIEYAIMTILMSAPVLRVLKRIDRLVLASRVRGLSSGKACPAHAP